MNEDELDDQEVTLEDETEETPDPLADLDEDTRALVEAAIEAKTKEIEAAKEAEFQQHKAQHSRRINTARGESGLPKFGMDLDENGNPVVRDPAAFARAALPFLTQEQAPPKDEPDEVPEWLRDDMPTLDKRTQRLVDQATGGLKAQIEELKQLVAQSVGYATQPTLANVPTLAREALESDGFGQLADHADFDAALVEAVKNAKLTPDQMRDPDAIAPLASMVGMHLQRQNPQGRTQRKQAPNGDAFRANLSRNSLGATAASRGNSRDGGYTQEEIEGAASLGVSPAAYRAAGEDPTGRKAVKLLQKGSR